MGKVKSFNLEKGARVGNYVIDKQIGRGWEGEVYKVREVPTDAVRAMKLFRADDFSSSPGRAIVHFAWYFEQVKSSGHFPTYYHYGQWFLDDDNGCFYLVFEYIGGQSYKNLQSKKTESEKQDLFFKLIHAVSDVHELGYAVGDLKSMDNIFILDDKVVFVDCNPGEPGNPNVDFEYDCRYELKDVAEEMSIEFMSSVISFFEKIDTIPSAEFDENTLTEILKVS